MKTVKSMLVRVFRRSHKSSCLFIGVFFLSIVSGYAFENGSMHSNEVITVGNRIYSLTENPKFTKKFNSLVSRAYFKLLVEAERADIRLANEYKRLYAKNENRMDDLTFQEEFVIVYKRFLTHRRMLSGLKSWRIFSEDRTGDLEYFKREYRKAIYTMYQDKASDDKMVVFLMYRLADLYHLPQ